MDAVWFSVVGGAWVVASVGIIYSMRRYAQRLPVAVPVASVAPGADVKPAGLYPLAKPQQTYEEAMAAFSAPLIDYAGDVLRAYLETDIGDNPNLDLKRRAVEQQIGRFENGIARFNFGVRFAGSRKALVEHIGGLTDAHRATFKHADDAQMTDEEILNGWLAVMSAWQILAS